EHSTGNDRRLVLATEERARWAGPDLGAELHGHGIHRVSVPEEQLASGPPPPWLTATSHGDAPAGASLPQLPHINLVPARLVGDVREPATIGRQGDPALLEGRP